MRDSSIGHEDEWQLTGPGQRSGQGSDSLIRYLNGDEATKPQELLANDQHAQHKPRRSLVSRLRRALLNFRK